jgi:hypothetical protein
MISDEKNLVTKLATIENFSSPSFKCVIVALPFT